MNVMTSAAAVIVAATGLSVPGSGSAMVNGPHAQVKVRPNRVCSAK
jgi:hypothetical protein